MAMSIVSKMYCSSSETILVVRRRPHVVNGGGFVVTDCSNKRVVFRVDGCGTLGNRGEIVVRDGDGDALLLIRRKTGGILEAMSIHKKWKGYTFDYEGSQKLVFSMKEPKYEASSCFSSKHECALKVSLESKKIERPDGMFEIKGNFPDRACSIVAARGNAIAQIGVTIEKDQLTESKDVYGVAVKAGMDQVFVCGVIAVLDYIHGESTAC